MQNIVAGRWLAVSTLFALAACGGGGGGSAPTPPSVTPTPISSVPPPAPPASAPASTPPASAPASTPPASAPSPTPPASAPVAPPATMTLSTAKATANFIYGGSATISVGATLDQPIAGSIYAAVREDAAVLTSAFTVAPADPNHLAFTIYTSGSLSIGHHVGNIQLLLCADAACATTLVGPVALPYDFDVEPTPLTALQESTTSTSVHWGGSLATGVTVDVAAAGLQWSATSTAPWLSVANGSSRNGAGSFSVNYAPSGLAVGHYADHVTVTSVDGQSVTVPFSLDVLPTAFKLDGGVPSFTAVNGAPIPSQALPFELDNGVDWAWTATSSANWLLLSATSGTTPASLGLQPDPTHGPLTSGSYQADVVLSSPGISSRTVSPHLTLIAPTLSPSVSTVTLGGPKGRDLVSSQSTQLSLNTGTNAWPVTHSALPSWLQPLAASRNVSQAPTSIAFAPSAASAASGSQSTAITFTGAVNGDTVTTPVTVNLNVDQRRLLPSTWGIGFASTPSGSVLTRAITIRDNFAGTLAWTATSDSAWLSATAAGTTGDASSLVLAANPAMLANDTIAVANVTVATTTANVSPATIRVALWKSATGASTITSLVGVNPTALTADKIRPLVYTTNGGTDVSVYNAYTASLVATIPAVGSGLGQMTVSPDGSRLYVLDTVTRTMKVVDLGTRLVIDSWALTNAVSGWTNLIAIRPNGVEVVLLGDGTAYSNGRSLGTPGISGQLTATDDGKKVYTTDQGFSPASVSEWDVDYSEMAGGTLFAAAHPGAFDSTGGENGRDIAVTGDGTGLYTAAGYPYACGSVNPSTLDLIGHLPGGNPYPNNVEVTSSNQVVCGLQAAYNPADILVYSSAGALVGSYKVAGYGAGLQSNLLVVTPDGFIVVAESDDMRLAFVPIAH
jgi:hypothetical protein